MVEIIKELSKVLKDLPDLAIWIMVGVLFYKVFIVGGILGLIKFFINKLYSAFLNYNDYKLKPKPKTVYVLEKIDNDFICYDGTYLKFKKLISEVKNKRIRQGEKGDYIHSDDVDYLIQAFNEKLERDIERKLNNEQK